MEKTGAERANGRLYNQMRSLDATFDVFQNASSSLLFSCGNTKILCAVTIQPGVPQFLRGSGSGWLNAEYVLLPASTKPRTQREISTMRRNKRSVEISRLMSRALRAICDLSCIGERTIMVDCDVLQADGGTRVASITAASIALQLAQSRWLKKREIGQPFMQDEIAAVSVGVQHDEVILDPDYLEDSSMQADFNVIMTKSGKLIEVQGGVEKGAISWNLFDEVRTVAQGGIEQLFSFFAQHERVKKEVVAHADQHAAHGQKTALFSLKSRLQKQA